MTPQNAESSFKHAPFNFPFSFQFYNFHCCKRQSYPFRLRNETTHKVALRLRFVDSYPDSKHCGFIRICYNTGVLSKLSSSKTFMFTKILSPVSAILILTAAVASAQDWRSGIPWEKPPIVTPGYKPNNPPSDAIVLFDGTDMSEWDKEWSIVDGELHLVPGQGDITTKRKFGSVQMHIEFATPADIRGRDQGRGNSGVFFGPYEVQILDSYQNETYPDGQCASIYKQTPPLVNACKPPGEWQTYTIIFNRPELKI